MGKMKERVAQRRAKTGRTVQVNVKATRETVDLLNSLADEMRVPLGAVLEMALRALVAQRASVTAPGKAPR